MPRTHKPTILQPGLLPGIEAEKPKLPHLSANVLNRYVIGHIIHREGYAWRNNTGAAKFAHTNKEGKSSEQFVRFGLEGSSDVLGITADGRFIAVETKTPNDRLSDKQRAFLAEIERRGGIALVVGDANYAAEIDAALAKPPAWLYRVLGWVLRLILARAPYTERLT